MAGQAVIVLGVEDKTEQVAVPTEPPAKRPAQPGQRGTVPQQQVGTAERARTQDQTTTGDRLQW